MIPAIKDYLLGLRVGRMLGRTYKFSRRGQKAEAASSAREILSMLRRSGLDRDNVSVTTGLICATIELERVTEELGQPGADHSDLLDAVAAIRDIHSDLPQSVADWLPYLEYRLQKSSERLQQPDKTSSPDSRRGKRRA